MPKKVEVDPDGLRRAAELLSDLRDDFEAISAKATGVVGNMSKACGTDHFGHKFTDGKDGFKAKCTSAGKNLAALSESFDQYTSGVGDSRGAAEAMDGSEDISSENLRRAV